MFCTLTWVGLKFKQICIQTSLIIVLKIWFALQSIKNGLKLLHLRQLNTCKSVQYSNLHVIGHVDAESINLGGALHGGVSTSGVVKIQL